MIQTTNQNYTVFIGLKPFEVDRHMILPFWYTNIAMENRNFNSNISYKGAMFNLYASHHQRVDLGKNKF